MGIDYDALFGAEEYDPCEVVTALRPVVMKLRVEGGIAEIKFRDRTTKFQRTDMDDLINLLAQMETECAAKQGKTPKRRAHTVGVRMASRSLGRY